MTVLDAVPCEVGGDLIVRSLPDKARARLVQTLRFPNQKFVRAKRLGRSTGAEPRWIETAIEMPDGSVHCPRGSIRLVKESLAEDGLVPRVQIDHRIAPLAMYGLREPLGFVGKYVFQQEGVNALVTHLQGMIVLPCGVGKSRLGIGAIHAVGCRALVIVHTIDLADQWAEQTTKLLGLLPGRIGGGETSFDFKSPITIAVIDSLVPLLEERAFGWDPAPFGLVIVDEMHRAPSKTFQRALRLLPARYRLGLTATPFREDGMDPLMEWSFGPRLLEKTTAEMIAAEVLMPAEIEIIETGFTFHYDGPDKKRLAQLDRDVTTDLSRNVMIAERAAAEARAGETVLVLTNRKLHVMELAQMIQDRGVGVKMATSATSRKKRKGAIQEMRDGDLSVFVATSLADTGLDIPRLSRILLAFPQRAKGGTIQRLGRLLRNWPGKKPKLIDYWDSNVKTLASRSLERKRVYREAMLLGEDSTT